MTRQVVITPAALEMQKDITEGRIRGQVSDAIDGLCEDTDKKGRPLLGELGGFRSLRAAGQKYRVIYKVESKIVTVVVVAVGTRKEVGRKNIYSLARKLFEQRLLCWRISNFRFQISRIG